MRASSAFTVGVLSGALAVIVALRTRQVITEEDPNKIADQVAKQLEWLENKAVVEVPDRAPHLKLAK